MASGSSRCPAWQTLRMDAVDAVFEERWFLGAGERGNPVTSIRPGTLGNRVEALVHGGSYFPRLLRELRDLRDGDLVVLADWRGDPDERLDGPAAPANLSGEAPAPAVRPRRRAQRRPRVRQGVPACAGAHLRRGPVPVVRGGRPDPGRRPAAYAVVAPDRGGPSLPGPGRAAVRPTQPHRSAGGHRPGAGRGRRSRRRLRPRERGGHADLRPRQGVR